VSSAVTVASDLVVTNTTVN